MLAPSPRSGATDEIDLAHYGWSVDLSQSFSGLRRHAIEEAGRVHPTLPGADRRIAQLNLYLLICAASRSPPTTWPGGGLILGPSAIGSLSVASAGRLAPWNHPSPSRLGSAPQLSMGNSPSSSWGCARWQLTSAPPSLRTERSPAWRSGLARSSPGTVTGISS